MPTQMPIIHRTYNSYAELTKLNAMNKEELRLWMDQLIDYALVRKANDGRVFGRKRVDPDKVNYVITCKAVNLLRVKNLESVHRPHVQGLVNRQNASSTALTARMVGENTAYNANK